MAAGGGLQISSDMGVSRCVWNSDGTILTLFWALRQKQDVSVLLQPPF